MLLFALALLAAPPELLVIRGNTSLVEDVYRSVLDLPASTKATKANARSVASRLRRFLRKAGYTLATVGARVEGEQIAVQIDEGRLDKIIFVGGGAFETLRLRLELHLHDDVYNQNELERQLKALSRRLGLSDFAYEVVPVEDKSVRMPQLDDLEQIEELPGGIVRPGRPYELHILVQPGEFHSGLSPELEIDSLEGGGLGAVYHSGRLVFEQDRFQLGGRIAGGLRQKLDRTGSRFAFTRALGEASYQAAPLFGFIRPSIRASADLSARQRPDLRLESFQFAILEAGALVLFVPISELRFSLGAGVQRRLLRGVEQLTGEAAPPPPVLDSLAQSRPYADFSLEVTFDPSTLRLDQHHQLGVQLRTYAAPHAGVNGAMHLGLRYQKVFAIGWNELWIEAHGFSRTGDVVFPEEESVGSSDFLRGPFGAEYARRAGGLNAEFRFSLLRDVLKLGVFHNLIAYGALDRFANTEKPAAADSFGAGIHALIIDEFQLDAYFGVGYGTGGRFDRGAALSIRQAF